MSYCSNCGKELDGGAFCSNCGAAVEVENERPSVPNGTADVTPRAVTPSGEIVLGPNGVYRWVYELNLFTNPTILFVLWKIFACCVLGLFVFLVLISMGNSRFWFDGFLDLARTFGLLLLGMLALVLLGYLVYALISGGKYCVLFEMDENGVKHIQLPKEVKRGQAIGMLTSLAGAASGKLGMVGTGLLISSKNSSSSSFKVVRSVECYPRRHVIKVNALLNKNQVYCSDADFEFVRDYIISRCINAKKVRK